MSQSPEFPNPQFMNQEADFYLPFFTYIFWQQTQTHFSLPSCGRQNSKIAPTILPPDVTPVIVLYHMVKGILQM